MQYDKNRFKILAKVLEHPLIRAIHSRGWIGVFRLRCIRGGDVGEFRGCMERLERMGFENDTRKVAILDVRRFCSGLFHEMD